MKLYSYWRSSSAWRVRIALAWKGLAYEYVPVHLVNDGGEQNRPAFRALNPLGQVPVLELPPEGGEQGAGGARRLTQSMAILEYLEERYPQPPLLPGDAWQRARVRQLAQLINAGIQPLQNLAVLNQVRDVLRGDAELWARHFNTRGLAALEQEVAGTAGRFLAGDAPSYADVLLVPQLYSARRFGVDLGGMPTLTRVEAVCAALPAFRAAHPDAQPDAPPPGG